MIFHVLCFVLLGSVIATGECPCGVACDCEAAAIDPPATCPFVVGRNLSFAFRLFSGSGLDAEIVLESDQQVQFKSCNMFDVTLEEFGPDCKHGDWQTTNNCTVDTTSVTRNYADVVYVVMCVEGASCSVTWRVV